MPDACDLATAAGLTTMTGIEFGAAEPDTESSTEHDSVCYWQPIDDIHPVVMVAVSDDPEAGARFRVEVQELVEDSVVIDGAGQVWMDLEGSTIHMLVGDVYVEVAHAWSSADSAEITTAIAEMVAARL